MSVKAWGLKTLAQNVVFFGRPPLERTKKRFIFNGPTAKGLIPPHPFVKWFMKLLCKKDNGYKRSEIDMRYIKKIHLILCK